MSNQSGLEKLIKDLIVGFLIVIFISIIFKTLATLYRYFFSRR
jgi:hypothetical protein